MKSMQLGTSDYYKFFNPLKESQDVVIVWQANAKTRDRIIMETAVNFFTDSAKTVNLSIPPGAFIMKDEQIFCYVKTLKAIFKCELEEVHGANFTVSYPTEIKVLERHDIPPNFSLEGSDKNPDWRVRRFSKSGPESFSSFTRNKRFDDRSLRDQVFLTDKMGFAEVADQYKDLSEDDDVEKYIEIIPEGAKDSQPVTVVEMTRTGLTFQTFFLDDFPIFSEIRIAGLGDFRLDDSLVGVIMAHKQIEGFEQRVTVKFLEEAKD